MNKSLIIMSLLAMSLSSLPFSSNAGISISFGTGYGSNGYHNYGYAQRSQCYYPCYNRYGQAYACYPRSGAACTVGPRYNRYYSSNIYDPYYYNSAPRIIFYDNHRWDKRSYKSYHRNRGYNGNGGYRYHRY